MATKKSVETVQDYPRENGQLLASSTLFPRLSPPMSEPIINRAIDVAFDRCTKNKQGKPKEKYDTPEKLVELCIKHLKERSDPILSPYFVSQCRAEEIFELDAVSHEMQRHRMSIGMFYQYLLLELMKKRGWDASDSEGDIMADMNTPKSGLRLYMSVKKSKDTVGGQDIGDAIKRLEKVAKNDKNRTRPYLCVLCVATLPKGKISSYSDRRIKCDKQGRYPSLNCEIRGPGFVFPYITGREPIEIYTHAIKRVAGHLPFMTLRFRKQCSVLLKQKLQSVGLLNRDETVNPEKFLAFTVGE